MNTNERSQANELIVKFVKSNKAMIPKGSAVKIKGLRGKGKIIFGTDWIEINGEVMLSDFYLILIGFPMLFVLSALDLNHYIYKVLAIILTVVIYNSFFKKEYRARIESNDIVQVDTWKETINLLVNIDNIKTWYAFKLESSEEAEHGKALLELRKHGAKE